jgi:hypothetical protein
MISLDELITEKWSDLVDAITKDAVRRIRSYANAPLRTTMERVERWLKTLAESIAKNQPDLLAEYLAAVGEERREEGYPIGDLHAIVHTTEEHLSDLIEDTYDDPVEQNGQMALLTAVMDSARMTLSVTYILSMAAREPRFHPQED